MKQSKQSSLSVSQAAQISPQLKQSLIAHYERQLGCYGPTAQGMDWKDAASQQLRFSVLCGVCDLHGKSVHEVGAGAGHLYDFLQANRIAADYSGSDLSAAMIAAARRRHPEVSFEQCDLLTSPCLPSADIVLCSGLFHVKLQYTQTEWRAFVQAMLHRMYQQCRIALAFNVMSDLVDFQSENLYYAPIHEMLDFCRQELSRFVVLRHDYPLYEYTLYVYRHAPSVSSSVSRQD